MSEFVALGRELAERFINEIAERPDIRLTEDSACAVGYTVAEMLFRLHEQGISTVTLRNALLWGKAPPRIPLQTFVELMSNEADIQAPRT